MTRTSLLATVAVIVCSAALTAGCTHEEATPGGGNKPAARVAGAAPASGSARKKIVFVFKIGGISYSEACKSGAEQANSDPSIGADVEYEASAEGTAEKQADIINQAIVGKADAIVVSPVDASAVVPAIDRAVAAGIRVYTWDSDSPQSKRRFYVAAVDDVQIGSDIMNALAASMGGKGKILVFSGQRTAENLNKHVQGIETALKKLPGITAVTPYYYNDDDKNKATQMAVAALQAHPDITGIACVNSPSPPAAGEALRKAGLVGKVKVWGLALPSETRTYLKDGSVTGLYLWDPKELTYLTARLVKDDLDGKAPVAGAGIGSAGKLAVAGPIVTLPIGLQITTKNVDSLNF